jgi:hypothetical protein
MKNQHTQSLGQPSPNKRYYWSRKTHSVEQLRVIGGVVKW